MNNNNKTPSYNWNGKTILVVEDTDTTIRYFRAALKRTNADVLYAKNGLEAVQTVKTRKDINLILMDIHMPFMNGFEATREIRKMRKDINIIIQTAYVLSNEREKSFDAGCNEFIAKPISFKNLLHTINEFI